MTQAYFKMYQIMVKLMQSTDKKKKKKKGDRLVNHFINTIILLLKKHHRYQAAFEEQTLSVFSSICLPNLVAARFVSSSAGTSVPKAQTVYNFSLERNSGPDLPLQLASICTVLLLLRGPRTTLSATPRSPKSVLVQVL